MEKTNQKMSDLMSNKSRQVPHSHRFASFIFLSFLYKLDALFAEFDHNVEAFRGAQRAADIHMTEVGLTV